MKTPTVLSLTSGEILDIISLLRNKSSEEFSNENHSLGYYYHDIATSFERIVDKLSELPGEDRLATLVLALN